MSSKQRDSLAFVHHKKNGEIEVRRLNTGPTFPALARHLHYTSKDQMNACRCPHSRKHKQSTPVANDSTHVNARLTRFLDYLGADSCSLGNMHAFEERERLKWMSSGVDIRTFHYVSKDKDVVCRCAKGPKHGAGPVRNPEIVNLCAKFFSISADRGTCSKAEWRSIILTTLHDLSRKADPFDAPSSSEENNTLVSQEVPVLFQMEPESDMSKFLNSPVRGPAIPEEVWDTARPSMWSVPRGSVTSPTTPVGTAQTPKFPPDQKIQDIRGLRIDQPQLSRPVSAETCWSDVQQKAAGLPSESSPRSSRGLERPVGFSDDAAQPLRNSNPVGVTSRPSAPQELECTDPSPQPDSGRFSVPLAELPTNRTSIELDGLCHQVHPATLRKLEGHQADMVPERYSKYKSLTASVSVIESSLPSSKAISRLSSLLIKVQEAIDLPDQEEFLLRHVIACSRKNPAPAGDCALCTTAYDYRRKRAIKIPSCGHFVHEECLVANFRINDQVIGTCPICKIALCERGLADRIDTDRMAIFGTQHTRLRNEECVEFPSRGQAARLQSEEELAVAQLRLLKDYIDLHFKDVWNQWEVDNAEPDWYVAVIRPVIQLFEGWKPPSQQSRYFADRDAFLKLVAWAELVRMVNAMRKVDDHTECPPLAELHRKFMWAKKRYDKEKKTWKTNRHGALDCEKVAQDAFDLAMQTHTQVS